MDGNLEVVVNEMIEGDNFNQIVNLLPIAVNLAMPINNRLDPLYNIRQREAPPRNDSYYETTVPIYNLSEFKSHFRMSKNTMEVVIQTVGRQLQNRNHKIPVDKKCHFALWILSKPETFLAAGDRFNFAKSTGHKVFSEVVDALVQSIDDFIVWPNPTRQQQTSQVFQARSQGFPGIVGVIDATHIGIVQPTDNAMDYYNRKQVHSVILQAVCNENCKFISVSTGYPGRLHDARVFRNSALSESLNDAIEDPELHVIGDVAYPLKVKLLTPFRDNGHLRPNEVKYNKSLSSVRSTIERSFSRLKNKFRRLKLLELTKPELISSTIIACCVLHNIIIDGDGLSDDEDYSSGEDEPDDHPCASAQVVEHGAVAKRKRIAAVV